MNSWFIFMTFCEFLVFTVLAVKTACKYLPIFTTQSIILLLAFMLGYLIQAALFLRIRKSIGKNKINEQDTQTYDAFIRIISVVHWILYLLFFIMVFKIHAIIIQFKEKGLQNARNAQVAMKIFIVFYSSIILLFHSVCIFLEEKDPLKYKIIYVLGGITVFTHFIMFMTFICELRHYFKVVDQIKGQSCFRILIRYTLLLLWFLIFMTDIVHDTFLRPGGSLQFL